MFGNSLVYAVIVHVPEFFGTILTILSLAVLDIVATLSLLVVQITSVTIPFGTTVASKYSPLAPFSKFRTVLSKLIVLTSLSTIIFTLTSGTLGRFLAEIIISASPSLFGVTVPSLVTSIMAEFVVLYSKTALLLTVALILNLSLPFTIFSLSSTVIKVLS